MNPVPDVILLFYDSHSSNINRVKELAKSLRIEGFEDKKCIVVGAKSDLKRHGGNEEAEDDIFVTRVRGQCDKYTLLHIVTYVLLLYLLRG